LTPEQQEEIRRKHLERKAKRKAKVVALKASTEAKTGKLIARAKLAKARVLKKPPPGPTSADPASVE
jgi:hypothetical protein